MKSRYFFITLLLTVLVMLPKNVMASDISVTNFIDYRFFVEDQDENEIGNLHFKLYDMNNYISINSTYDENSGAYYFVDFSEKTVGDDFLPDNLISELINNYGSITNHPGIYLHFGIPVINIPFILEEVNHMGSGEPIKKIVFAEIAFFQPDTFPIYLINNTCSASDNYFFNLNEDNFSSSPYYYLIDYTRKTTVNYSDELMNKYFTADLASSEINSDDYLNKGYIDSNIPIRIPFTSSEVSGSNDSNFNYEGTSSKSVYSPKVVKLRTSDDNIKENVMSDYCSCLPVFVQQRTTEKSNIVKILTNPKTWTNGVGVLVLTVLIVIGCSIMTLRKKKS